MNVGHQQIIFVLLDNPSRLLISTFSLLFVNQLSRRLFWLQHGRNMPLQRVTKMILHTWIQGQSLQKLDNLRKRLQRIRYKQWLFLFVPPPFIVDTNRPRLRRRSTSCTTPRALIPLSPSQPISRTTNRNRLWRKMILTLSNAFKHRSSVPRTISLEATPKTRCPSRPNHRGSTLSTIPLTHESLPLHLPFKAPCM